MAYFSDHNVSPSKPRSSGDNTVTTRVACSSPSGTRLAPGPSSPTSSWSVVSHVSGSPSATTGTASSDWAGSEILTSVYSSDLSGAGSTSMSPRSTSGVSDSAAEAHYTDSELDALRRHSASSNGGYNASLSAICGAMSRYTIHSQYTRTLSPTVSSIASEASASVDSLSKENMNSSLHEARLSFTHKTEAFIEELQTLLDRVKNYNSPVSEIARVVATHSKELTEYSRYVAALEHRIENEQVQRPQRLEGKGSSLVGLVPLDLLEMHSFPRRDPGDEQVLSRFSVNNIAPL